MKLLVKKGKTSKRATIFIQDATSATQGGLTGLTNASSGLVCYRYRDDDGDAGGTQLTLAGGTRGTWSSGGFKEKDATNLPGVYELGLDNAGLATGSEVVVYQLKGATNMVPCVLEIQLVDFDPQDTVRLGLTSLPNAAAEAAGGLYTRGTGAGQIRQDANGRIDANAKAWIDGTIPAVGITGVPKVDIHAASGATTLAELAQAKPAATPTVAEALMLLYMAFRNAGVSTASQLSVTNDAGTVICKAALSDDGSTFTRAELAAGP